MSKEEAVTAINSTLNCNANLSVRPTISAADTKKSKVKVQRTPDYRGKSKYTCCVHLVNCRAATVFQVRGTLEIADHFLTSYHNPRDSLSKKLN